MVLHRGGFPDRDLTGPAYALGIPPGAAYRWRTCEPTRGGEMIQRILAIVIGSAVTFVLLILFDSTRLIPDRNTGYLIAILIGGIANFFWPVILGWRAARRVKE